MKLLGILLLLLGAAMGGCTAANHLQATVTRRRLLRQLTDAMMTCLRFTLPTIDELMQELAAQPCFRALPFLQAAAADARGFPTAWDAAITADRTLLPPELAILTQIGQILGSTDLEGQLSALSLCQEQLAERIAEAEAIAQTRGKLYRAMGILTGVFVVILLL